jgi:hypothetical protein
VIEKQEPPVRFPLQAVFGRLPDSPLPAELARLLAELGRATDRASRA